MALGPFGEAAASFDELHEQEFLRAVVNLGDGKIALLPEVAEHVSLPLQVRLAFPIYLGDERGAFLQLRPVHLSYTAASERTHREHPLSEVCFDTFGDDVLSHVSSGACRGCHRGVPRTPLLPDPGHARNHRGRRRMGRGPRVPVSVGRIRGRAGPPHCRGIRRARWARRSSPRAAALLWARSSGGLPTCQEPVPAESTRTSSSSPSRRSMSSKTPWANGERQILPKQT